MRRYTSTWFFFFIFFLSFFFSAHAAKASDTSNSLVGYWKLDETSTGGAGSVADSSGRGNTGSPVGAIGVNNKPQPTSTYPGLISFTDAKSLSFDGTDDYVSTSMTGFNTGTSARSIGGWIKMTNTATVKVPFAYGGCGAGNDTKAFGVYFDASEDLHFWGCGTGDFDTGVVVSTGSWHHIMATYDGTNVRVYVDGTQAGATTARTLGVGSTAMQIGGASLLDSSNYYFNGLIDDVRVYNRALSQAEVTSLASGTHTSSTWLGGTSTNWETASNWSTNAVPDNYTVVTIENGTYKPAFTANVKVAGLTINSNALLDLVSYNFTMNDSGTFSNDGTLQLRNSQTLTNFVNDTNSGTILVNATGDTTGLKTGSSYYDLIINDGLLGYWKMDESSSGAVADSSGYQNHGAPSGSDGPFNNPAPSANIPNTNFTNHYSLDFDGTDDVVTTTLNISSLSAFTLSGWLYPTATGTKLGFFGQNDAIEFGFSDGNHIQCWTSSGGSVTWAFDTGTFPLDQWHHVGCVGNGTTLTLYIDGTAQATGGSATGDYGSSSYNFTLGGTVFDATGNNYYGNIDDVRVYKRALSGTQITALYNGNHPGTSATTLTLDENQDINGRLILSSGTLQANSGGSSYNINIAGNWQNDGGVFTPGSGRVTFDGLNQQITSSNTFFNFNKTVSSADTLTFAAGSTQTITNIMTLGGLSGSALSLRSTQTYAQWKIDPQGIRSVNYLDVRDSNNINSAVIAGISFNVFNSGNNINWTFSPGATYVPEFSDILYEVLIVSLFFFVSKSSIQTKFLN